LQYTALLEPPRDVGLVEADTMMASSPSSAALFAVIRPEVPQPTTTTSASMVSAI
jgi:hypothetical protein